MVPVPSTSYSWNTAAMNSRSSLLRDCHPPFWPLRMRLAAAARFRLSLCRTLSGLASSCTMTAMVPALEKIQPSETLCSVSGETLSGTRESTSARVSLDARRSSRSERATRRRASRVRGRESARRVRNIPTSNSSPAAKVTPVYQGGSLPGGCDFRRETLAPQNRERSWPRRRRPGFRATTGARIAMSALFDFKVRPPRRRDERARASSDLPPLGRDAKGAHGRSLPPSSFRSSPDHHPRPPSRSRSSSRSCCSSAPARTSR